MQRVSISHATPGMVVARNIFGADGKLMLAEGMELTHNRIRLLERIGILSVYIRNPYFEDVVIPEVMREEVRVKAVAKVQQVFRDFRITHQLNADRLQNTARQIVAEVLSNSKVMLHMTEIRTHDDYTFVHSVQVCAISVLIGTVMGYPNAKLMELALGALLHDVGKMMIPQEILNKPGKLDSEEMEVIRLHPEKGFEFLRQKHPTLSLLAMHVAFQHHEKYDGSGYPRGLQKKDIHEYARIVAIADVYDALVSDRPYRVGMLPHEAYEILMALVDAHLDGEILILFLRNLAVYPVGCVVQLNTGDFGVVIDVRSGLQWRPVLRLIADKQRRLYQGDVQLDLATHLTTAISRVVPEDEIFALGYRPVQKAGS